MSTTHSPATEQFQQKWLEIVLPAFQIYQSAQQRAERLPDNSLAQDHAFRCRQNLAAALDHFSEIMLAHRP